MKISKFKPEISLDRDSVIPLRAQIVEQLRKGIIRNRLAAGTKLISERQLANKLEINRNTVHQAYEQLAEDGYLAASELRGGGMVVAPTASEYYRAPFPSLNLILPYRFSEQLKLSNLQGLEIIGGIMDRAAELHISVNITALPEVTLPKDEIENWLEMFIPRSIGIITLGLRSRAFDPVFGELLQCRMLPHVFVSGTSPLPHVSSVTSSTAQGAKEMLQCLKKFGHRHLAVAAISPYPQNQFQNCAFERGETIVRLASKYGISTSLIPIDALAVPEQFDYQHLIDRLLTDRPTAIWIQNDEFARYLGEELSRRGLRVPEDISLIGYDNLSTADELSTIDHSRAAIGAQAVNIIAELFDHGSPGDALHRTIASNFIQRKSITYAKPSSEEAHEK
jgi:DNA-binding LacI/PurR family transcriptional regulator/biotin operon repressor